MRSVPISPKQIAPSDDGRDIDLLQMLGTLRRGKWRILFWMAVLACLGAYYAMGMVTPLYTTTATIAMQDRNEQIVDLASPLSSLGGDFYTINTEVEAMTSRELIGTLVDKLDLVSDPAFNYSLRPKDDSWSIGKAIGAVRSAIMPRPDAKPVERTPEEVREGVINSIIGSIDVSNLRASYVFYITATTDDPKAAMRLANGLAEVYIEEQIALKYRATEQATIWLNGRVAELKDELEKAENAVKEFNAETDLVGPEALEALNRQLKDRRDRVLSARTEVGAMAARVTEIEAALQAGDRSKIAAIADDPTLNQLIGRIDGEGVQQAFDARAERVLERARFEARQSDGKIASLEKSVSELEAQVVRQSAELLKLQQLEREAAASRQIYEYFLGRLKEISVQQGIHRPDSRILSRAVVPDFPSKPRTKLIIASALLLGFAIGAGSVLVREMRQTGFRSAQDLEQATGLTVFAQIPQAPVTKRRRILNYLVTKPASAMSEAVRNLRTSVLLSNIDSPPQIIMLTSSLPGEGKTTQSLALAQSFAGMDKRVLVIEGDIRRRTFQEYFRATKHPGLITAVAGTQPLDQVILSTDQLGADVLLGEKSAVNAADFFSSAKFKSFIEELRGHYDVIVIDTPPVLVVPDARVIGQLVDAIIYVVHWNKTTRTQVEEGLNALASVDLKVAGLLLSQIDLKEAKGYGGKYSELYGGYGRRYYHN